MTAFKYLLQLFAGGEGGVEGGAEGAAEAQTGSEVGLAPQQDGNQPAEGAERDLDKEWAALKKGDYKAQYDKDVKSAVDRRFKSAKAAEENLAKLSPLLEAVATKYGKATDDVDGILQAMSDDDSYYENAAYEAGMSVTEFKQKIASDRETEALRKFKEQTEREREWKQKVGVWAKQAEEAKATFPDLDLLSEMQNPETRNQFMGMLSSGVDVKTAYQAIHFNDLVTKSNTAAAQRAQQATVNSIRANGMRPVENGLSAQTPVSQKVDVANLTAAQINNLFERAARGERIDLKHGY